jgi:hypothetical protein
MNIDKLIEANKRIAELEDEQATQDLVNQRTGELNIKARQQAILDAIFNSEQVELKGNGYVGTYVSLEDLEVNILQLGAGR